MTGVLVTGGSGFVGRPLLDRLVAGGEEVHAISTSSAPEPIEGVRWHRLDLADAAALDEALRAISPERLVHLAWYVEHGRFWTAPENVLWVERSLALLRAFAGAGGRRAVMVGTCAEYDWSQARAPLDELTSPLAPATPYGVAKDSLHKQAASFADEKGLDFAWGRLFFMYGPREQPQRLVSSVIRALLRGEPVATTPGEQRRDFMHIDDVAGALAALLSSPVCGPVNIASGDARRVRDIVAEIAEQLGASELVRRGELPERAQEPPALVASVERLVEEVGYRPRIGLADGIADSIRWWREYL